MLTHPQLVADPFAARLLLRAAFEAAVKAVHPAQCLAPFIPTPGPGRTILVGAGKAAVSMARAFVAGYAAVVEGDVVVPHGQGLAPGDGIPGVQVLEAGHPVPDEASTLAAARILARVRDLTAIDRVVFLASGGGSALLAMPAPGLTLADKQQLTRQLLASGATIAEINCVRKKLSAVKGGRLALAAVPAEVLVLALSDVPGDNVADIASGPCDPDPTTLAQARAVLDRYDCRLSAKVRAFLADASHEAPKPGDRAFARISTQLCARSADALAAAARVITAAGFTPVPLGDAVNAPAVDVAREHASLALRYRRQGGRFALISGGETTVLVRNPAGRGGRNTEYLLALALALNGSEGVVAFSGDTDGIDGTQAAAGALLAPDTLDRAASLGLDASALLQTNCSWDLFAALDDLVITGPTGTNANDVRIILTGIGGVA